MRLKLVLALILTSLATAFIAQNVVPVDVGFLYWKALTRALLILPTLFVGLALGWFWHGNVVHRRSGRDSVCLP